MSDGLEFGLGASGFRRQPLIVGGSVYVGQPVRVGHLEGGDLIGVAGDDGAPSLIAADRSQFWEEMTGEEDWRAPPTGVCGVDDRSTALLEAGHYLP